MMDWKQEYFIGREGRVQVRDDGLNQSSVNEDGSEVFQR